MSSKIYSYFIGSLFLVLGLFLFTRTFDGVSKGKFNGNRALQAKNIINRFNEKVKKEPWLINNRDWSEAKKSVKLLPGYNKKTTDLVKQYFYRGLRELLEKAKHFRKIKIERLAKAQLGLKDIKMLNLDIKKINKRLYDLTVSGY